MLRQCISTLARRRASIHGLSATPLAALAACRLDFLAACDSLAVQHLSTSAVERSPCLATLAQLGFRTSSLRGFADSTQQNGANAPGSGEVQQANTILQRLDAAHFREVLDQEKETRWNMEYNDFLSLCVKSGAASSEEDAKETCDALDKAGVVLRVKNLVYLRPLEVAEIIFQALPDTDVEVKARLDKLKAEIAPLLSQKQGIDNHAYRVSRIVLWGGLVAVICQWLLFARLTFWELSWDVMEPVTYFTGAAFGIAAYTYCLWYNEEFGYHKARERIHTSVADRTYARKGFDKAKFDYLLRRIHRLESSLQAIVPLKHTPEAGS